MLARDRQLGTSTFELTENYVGETHLEAPLEVFRRALKPPPPQDTRPTSELVRTTNGLQTLCHSWTGKAELRVRMCVHVVVVDSGAVSGCSSCRALACRLPPTEAAVPAGPQELTA